MSVHAPLVVLDFGSQYTQLIARRVRSLHVLSIVLPGESSAARVRELRPRGLILSGGPASVYGQDAPGLDPELLELGVPVLGICYGLQLMAALRGSRVESLDQREYGPALLEVTRPSALLQGLEERETVWMSHADTVQNTPRGFEVVARTEDCAHAVVQDTEHGLYGLQFHPEVVHTPHGDRVLANFAYEVCGCKADWTPKNMLRDSIERIRQQVGTDRVLAGVSGGVDSTVLAALLEQACPGQTEAILVDNGLLREDEARSTQERFAGLGIPLRLHDAGDEFLAALEGVEDPEEKRRRIGHTFVRVFESAIGTLVPPRFLAQGTLYPDVIESSVHGGHSTTIKTHHNVGGLPADMRFELLEPLRDLFKDEVRRLGKELGLPHSSLGRHPFPGPGLAVRILGPVTRARLATLRQCDTLFIDELERSGWYDRVWQAFAVLLPVRSVGVMGDGRTYENVVALRAVTSVDGMTADWVRLPHDLLARVAARITNRVQGVNRVVYDVSSKPPSTIEWE